MRRMVRRTGSRRAPQESGGSALLLGYVDEPPNGVTVRRGPLVVRGWHRWGVDPGLAVTVSLDGVPTATAGIGTELRPDVAEVTGVPRLANAGWTTMVDLSGHPPGPARLTIMVWPSLDQPPVRAGTVDLVIVEPDGYDDDTAAGWGRPVAPPDQFFGRIDLPEGDEIRPTVTRIVGWALTEPHPVSSLAVLVNGEDCGRARLGLERLDLWKHHRVPHAVVAGFEHLIDLRRVRMDDHGDVTIEIVGRTVASGPATVVRRSWRVRAAPRTGPELSNGLRRVSAPRPGSSQRARFTGSRLHLAAFTHDMGYGGGQLWLTELLAKSGAGDTFDCTIVSPKGGPLVAEMEERNVRVHVTQEYPLTSLPNYEGRMAEISALLRQEECDAVLANTFLSFPAVDTAVRMGIPVVWALHESWDPSAIWSVAYPPGHVDPGVRLVAERALRHAGALVFEADATRLQYLGSTGPGRSIVIPYGINVEAIAAYQRLHDARSARRELGIPEDARVLLVMGTTEPRKAQTVLAEAFARVRQHHDDAALVMVGDLGNSYAEALHSYVEKSGIASRTTLVPVVKDTYRWYQVADVLVCASDVESLPRSVLEAMCFGKPVLATSVFGLAELIEDGRTGYLFEPCDLEAATAALERVLDSTEAELTAVGSRARELVEAEYDSRWYSADVLSLIEGLRRDPDRLPADILATNGSERWRRIADPARDGRARRRDGSSRPESAG